MTWKCLISRFIEDITSNDEISFLFLNLDIGPRISIPGGFAYNWQSKWVGIIAIKTEGTQIHFLSDVLADVASLDLKVPINLFTTFAHFLFQNRLATEKEALISDIRGADIKFESEQQRHAELARMRREERQALQESGFQSSALVLGMVQARQIHLDTM